MQIHHNWQNSNITPVNKGCSHNIISNYQPINLTSVAGKILEGIMNTHIVRHLTTNELLSDSQHSFRHGCSVETNLIDVYDYIIEHLDQAIPVDLVLLDFAKAFDRVCHVTGSIKWSAPGNHLGTNTIQHLYQ
ncbi:uncharacterized protein LOC136031541 [Artemia franciscana]|uniref:uncharacterized protein LOC136031541 n=1 Tax=Artemia franciscana TaxID=6661 RepID=UPI0032DA126B